MAFPTKMYFSLSEISARWHRQTKDVEYANSHTLKPIPLSLKNIFHI